MRLLKGVLASTDILSKPIVIQYGNNSVDTQDKECEWIKFTSMKEFETRIKEAEILILHAGAGSLIHAIQAGKIPIVMPRRAVYKEHVDDHQVELAERLAQENKLVLVMESEDLKQAVAKARVLKEKQSVESTKVPQKIHLLVENALSN